MVATARDARPARSCFTQGWQIGRKTVRTNPLGGGSNGTQSRSSRGCFRACARFGGRSAPWGEVCKRDGVPARSPSPGGRVLPHHGTAAARLSGDVCEDGHHAELL